MPPFSKFYLRDGWTFIREGAGRVHIIKRDSSLDASPIIAEITLSPEEWAGVVANLSHAGETPDSFTDAQFVHMGHFHTPAKLDSPVELAKEGVPVAITTVKSDPSK